MNWTDVLKAIIPIVVASLALQAKVRILEEREKLRK